MQITTQDLWTEGREIQITATRPAAPDNDTLRLTWTLPSNPVAYDGAVVLLSEEPIVAQDYPVDGNRYTGSTNWAAPGSIIGKARVVAAFYGFFNDAEPTQPLTVTNLDPTKVYYASIHAASNVLQYYTHGSHSYPLEANNPVKKSSPYAGAIPRAVDAPQNPTEGQLYFDETSNTVFMWSEDQEAWIKANLLPVATGDAPYLEVGSLFYVIGSQTLRFFDGSGWVDATSANLRVKMAGAWAPFGGITDVGAYPDSPTSGVAIFLTLQAAISAPQTKYVKFFSLGQWYNPAPEMVQYTVNGGADWNNIKVPSYGSIFGTALPVVPSVGDFFYKTSSRELLVWTGANGWVRADSDQQGVPLQDKVGVGTDGTAAARLQLIQDIKTQLGWPAVCVELKEKNFQLAVKNGLTEFRRRADNAYEHRFISFTLTGGAEGGQNVYYLNDPRDKTDKVVNVLKIHRINQLGISSLSAETGLYAQAFYNQLYQGSNVDVLSIHLMNQLSELYEKIFAGNITFTWNEARRELLVLRRRLQNQERVILEVVMEREEQELINDRWAKKWIHDWSYADSLEQLGLIRSKYGTLPSAQGGLTLNGDALLALAAEKKAELLRQMLDYEVGNGGVNFGNAAFLIG